MRAALLLALVAAPALAQVPPAEIGQRFVPAPWWMREPVVSAIGTVQAELPANRARFSASFSVVERDAATASSTAQKRVADVDRALRALGVERVRVATTFRTRPLYEQYRQKDGSLADNERADKIDRYEVTSDLDVAVRDIDVLERAYRSVVAARPTSIERVRFSLDADNAAKTWIYAEAVKDAARRARLSVEASGGRLGAPKIVDPTGSVCQTPVLAGWPSYQGSSGPTNVTPPRDLSRYDNASSIVVTGSRMAAPPPPPPPAPGLDDAASALQVTLQPPLFPLNQTACVIYALLP